MRVIPTIARALFATAALVSVVFWGTGCGTGVTVVDPIYQGLVTTNGATLETDNVTLTLPPGWSAHNRSVAILPQPDPLPVDPAAGPIEEMPGLMCIGPVGFVLLVPGQIRYCYNPADIPAGKLETDVVLLEWDEVAGFFRVSLTAIQDLETHCFTDSAYTELGHIGVGVRVEPVRNFVFQANLDVPAAVQGQGLPVFIDGSLVLGADSGAVLPEGLPNSEFADLYIPSRDASHVLFRWSDSTNEASGLRAVDAPDGNIVFDADPLLSLVQNDPLFGWFFQGDRLFYAHTVFDPELQTQFDAFADFAIGGAEHQNLRDGPTNFQLIDVRISPDSSLALLRYQDFINFTQRADVISTATGALVGTDLPVLPFGSGTPMPRWLPDSSGLTFIDATSAVSRIDPDGNNVATLYTASSRILDWALAPGASIANPATARCAYIRQTSLVIGQGLVPGPSTFFDVDVVAGGSLVEQDLGGIYGLSELAWHPNGATVWCQFNQFARIIDGGPGLGIQGQAIVAPPSFQFVVSFDATDAATKRVIASAMGGLDISRTSGKVLLWMQSDTQDAQFPTTGFWELDPDGTGGTLVPTTGFIPVGPPRFLFSWRSAVCSVFSPYVR